MMTSEEIANVSEEEKHMAIKKYFGFDDNTIKYFTFYRYNQALIDKLYLKAKPFVQEQAKLPQNVNFGENREKATHEVRL